MTRTPIIAAILTALAAGGVAVAADGPSPSLSLITAGQDAGEEAGEDELEPLTSPTVTLLTATTTTVPPTTTTTAPTTTTTAAPAVEDMRLSCVAGPRPEVTCTWSKNEHPDFKGYSLSKRIGEGSLEEVGSTTDRAVTSKTDKDVQTGTRITYVIETLDADQQLLARGEVTVSCC